MGWLSSYYSWLSFNYLIKELIFIVVILCNNSLKYTLCNYKMHSMLFISVKLLNLSNHNAVSKEGVCGPEPAVSLSVPFLAEILSKEIHKIHKSIINCDEQSSYEPSSVQFATHCWARSQITEDWTNTCII